jgi:outer membrane lipoprotein SlyB
VTQVVGERDVRARADREGEIRADSHRGRNAAIGAVIASGAGAAIGATQGGREAAIGAAAGAAAGAALGATRGGNLVLDKGTRLELQLDRPLSLA